MTKMKKLLAVVLVCAIMAVCGASAFADISSSSHTIHTRLRNFQLSQSAGTDQFLNLYRSSTGNITTPSVPVSVWSRGSDEDQIWHYSAGYTEVVCNVRGPGNSIYSLNIYRGSNPYQCTVINSSGNLESDKIFTVDVGIVPRDYPSYALYAPSANSKVYWRANTSPYSEPLARWASAA
ncbi:MAG: hypothetical protein U0N53_09990 [Ruthenibacterium sp.]|jgi:hypothetical protein|nr:hypothetical protein [Ruthenibacterium sp.]